MLREISPLLIKLSKGENLTTKESEKAFDIILNRDIEGYFYTALTMGLMAKGITSDELLGFCKSRQKLMPIIKTKFKSSQITDNSGSGGDNLKTFNISTTASFIVSAAEIPVARQSFYAVTGLGGSADLFKAFGIDIINTSNARTLKNTLETIKISPYAADFFISHKRLKPTLTFINKRNKIGLQYLSPYHLAANLVTPIKMEKRIYGIFDNKYSIMLAELLRKLGYKRALIVCGIGGLDEVSNIGKTEFVELRDNKIKKYTLSPKDFGIKKAIYEDIKAGSAEQNVIDFLNIIFNKDKGPKRDIVLMNAACSFYIVGKVKSFKEGVNLAKQILEDGRASEKLNQLVNSLGDTKKLDSWKKKSGIF